MACAFPEDEINEISKLKLQEDQPKIDPDEDFPGFAAFIINIQPKGSNGICKFQERKGANEDDSNLQEVFEDKLGFKNINKYRYEHINLTIEQWDHRKSKGSSLNKNEESCESKDSSLNKNEESCESKDSSLNKNEESCESKDSSLNKNEESCESKDSSLNKNEESCESKDSSLNKNEESCELKESSLNKNEESCESKDSSLNKNEESCESKDSSLNKNEESCESKDSSQNKNEESCGNCLRCKISSKDHSKSKCFVLAISSHGREYNETEIIFSDGNILKLTEIFDALSDKNIPSLAGKPRVIILQVCRTNFADKEKADQMQDRGVEIQVEVQPKTGHCDASKCEEASSTEDDTDPVLKATNDPIEDISLQHVAMAKMPKDFLVIYPSVSGQRSQRNKKTGSWLIQGLKEVMLGSYYNEREQNAVDVLKWITKVARYIAQKATVVMKKDKDGRNLTKSDGSKIKDEIQSGFKSTVCTYNKLTDDLILYTKVESMPVSEEPTLVFPKTKKSKKSNKKM